MIYIKRNNQHQIIDIKFAPAAGLEEIGLFDKELKLFLEHSENEDLVKQTLSLLDMDMVRVIEDMIDILIHKDLIRFTDLPVPVQNKLLFKRSVRQSLSTEINLISDEETLNF